MRQNAARCVIDGRRSVQRTVGDESFGTLRGSQINSGTAGYSDIYMVGQSDGLRLGGAAEAQPLSRSPQVLTGEFVRYLALVLRNPPPHNLHVGLMRAKQRVCRAALDPSGKIYFEMSSKPDDTLARITRLYDRQASLSGGDMDAITVRGFDCFRAPGVLDRERGTRVAQGTRGPGQTQQLLKRHL